MLLSIAIVNLFTKPEATIGGVIFSGLLFLGFEFPREEFKGVEDKAMWNSISSISRRNRT